MKITTAWAVDNGDDTPYLLESYSEYDFDNWGGEPEFFIDKVARAQRERGATVRRLVIEIPGDAVENLFLSPVVAGNVVDQG